MNNFGYFPIPPPFSPNMISKFISPSITRCAVILSAKVGGVKEYGCGPCTCQEKGYRIREW